MITVEKATTADILKFLDNIRPMDAEEVRLTTGTDLYTAFLPLMTKDTVKVVKHSSGQILGIGGVEEEGIPHSARVWLLLTRAVEDYKIEFLRWSKDYHDYLLDTYEMIYNDVYMKNKLHIAYLIWLGAVFEPHDIRPDFLKFTIRRKGCSS